MVLARFSKNKITFVLLNHVFFVLIRGPFYTNLKVRIGVFLNNEADLALTIHFHLPKIIKHLFFLRPLLLIRVLLTTLLYCYFLYDFLVHLHVLYSVIVLMTIEYCA